jgi:hypothetical protein
MTLRTKRHLYRVTDSLGQVHKRDAVRTYTHVVIARKPGWNVQASWCSRLELATRTAGAWARNGWQVETITIEGGA